MSSGRRSHSVSRSDPLELPTDLLISHPTDQRRSSLGSVREASLGQRMYPVTRTNTGYLAAWIALHVEERIRDFAPFHNSRRILQPHLMVHGPVLASDHFPGTNSPRLSL